MIYLDNPRRRRRRTPTRGRGGRFVRRGCSPRRKRRRTYRRNPALALYGPAAAALGNPRRRRRSRRYAPKRRRRTYRRNPGVFRGGIRGYMRQLQNELPSVAWGLEGYLATSMVPGFLVRWLPITAKENNQAMYYGTKILVALMNGRVISGMMGYKRGEAAEIGGLLTVGAELLNQFVMPMVGLGTHLDAGYMDAHLDDGGMGAHSPGVTLPGSAAYRATIASGMPYARPRRLPVRLDASERLATGF